MVNTPVLSHPWSVTPDSAPLPPERTTRIPPERNGSPNCCCGGWITIAECGVGSGIQFSCWGKSAVILAAIGLVFPRQFRCHPWSVIPGLSSLSHPLTLSHPAVQSPTHLSHPPVTLQSPPVTPAVIPGLSSLSHPLTLSHPWSVTPVLSHPWSVTPTLPHGHLKSCGAWSGPWWTRLQRSPEYSALHGCVMPPR
jgi:hypothetical protein